MDIGTDVKDEDGSSKVNIKICNLMNESQTVEILGQPDTWINSLAPDQISKFYNATVFKNNTLAPYQLRILLNSSQEFTIIFPLISSQTNHLLIIFPMNLDQNDSSSPIIAGLDKIQLPEYPTTFITRTPYDLNYQFSFNTLPIYYPNMTITNYYLSSDNCKNCEYQPIELTLATTFFKDNSIGTKSLRVEILNGNGGGISMPTVLDYNSLQFESRGTYSLFYILATNEYKKLVIYEPESWFVPILIVVIFAIVVLVGKCIYNKYYDKIEADEYYSVRKNIQNTSSTPEYVIEERIVETDIFRGLSIVLFIVVNTGGGGYIFMNESVWDGMKLGDLPELMIGWITGFSTPFLIKYKGKIFKSKKSFIKFVFIKAFILIVFGFSYNDNYDLSKFIFTGFFQRLGFGFLVNVLLAYFIPFVKYDTERAQVQIKRVSIRSLIMALIPIANMIVTLTLPVPGCPTGYLRPGGIESSGANYNCTGGANRLIDIKIFGEAHLRSNPNCLQIYQCPSFDKYGLLGSLNFIFGVYLGVLVGEGFLKFKETKSRLVYVLSHCCVFLALVIMLILTMESYSLIPLNRSLYSITFVITGTLFVELTFAFLIFFRQYIKYTGWPFVQIGFNGVAILFMQEVCKQILPFGFGNDGNKRDLVICAIMNVTIWTAFALILHGYKFYIKI